MFINDSVLDNLSSLASATARRVDICNTAEPTTYTEATSTNSCGNKTGLTMTALSNGATDGRRVQTPAITDGNVTASQTAGFWALTDASSVLHAAGSLASAQAVTSGNTFTLGAISITIRDAA
ncbi:hypothetical protein [uncultured Paraglaciecola sp.]|uniref:hypothetical protein n=1 Tax=uncultured Paraglaciecola sp. TaxID=1765024 RepID=UPI002625F002|nr:hypothetical protein [uncultured Paraglaciecola sp.]